MFASWLEVHLLAGFLLVGLGVKPEDDHVPVDVEREVEAYLLERLRAAVEPLRALPRTD